MSTSSSPKYRVLLVDDHAVLRNGMRHLIDGEPDMEVVEEAEDGAKALELANELKPDVIVMDLSMPGMSGMDTIRQLTAADPSARTLVLTVHEDSSYIRELLRAGVLGYMLKRAAPRELVHAVRTVGAGNVYIDSTLASKLLLGFANGEGKLEGTPAKLTEREETVLRGIAEGLLAKEIASNLDISIKTVETYRARAAEKLGLVCRADIVRFARRQGWLNKI